MCILLSFLLSPTLTSRQHSPLACTRDYLFGCYLLLPFCNTLRHSHSHVVVFVGVVDPCLPATLYNARTYYLLSFLVSQILTSGNFVRPSYVYLAFFDRIAHSHLRTIFHTVACISWYPLWIQPTLISPQHFTPLKCTFHYL